jgi:hypothetical protein
MFSLYLFSLVVGGGMLLFSLFGGHDGDGHGGHVGHGHVGHDAHGHDALKFFSIRTLTYFLFAFGGVGAVLAKSWSWAAAPIVLVVAILAGLGVGAAVTFAFGYLQRTESGARESDDSFVGLTGRVTVPISSGSGMGKVLVERGGRTFELLAKPLETDGHTPAKWKAVVVVEMQRGTAVVMPADDPSVRELTTS